MATHSSTAVRQEDVICGLPEDDTACRQRCILERVCRSGGEFCVLGPLNEIIWDVDAPTTCSISVYETADFCDSSTLASWAR